MNCPYCNKDIYGMTGLQEAQKFEKHLKKCSKHPNRVICPSCGGEKTVFAEKCWSCNGTGKINYPVGGLKEALEIRAESGQ